MQRWDVSGTYVDGNGVFLASTVPASWSVEENGSYPMPTLRIVDSITELHSSDAGCITISGSHGGLSAARYALAVRPRLTVFNDAGVGLDDAGIAALSVMQTDGLAACTVAHTSARIGEAHSTLATGVVSHVNAQASAMGLAPGQLLQSAIEALVTNGAGDDPVQPLN